MGDTLFPLLGCLRPLVLEGNRGAVYNELEQDLYPLLRLRRLIPLGDRIGDRHRAARHVGVHALDHAAVDLDHALVLVLGLLKGRDDLARLFDLGRGGENTALQGAI